MLVELASSLKSLVGPVAGLGSLSGDAHLLAFAVLGIAVIWLAALVWVRVR